MIKINSLTHHLGAKTVLCDVDLTVNDGSIVGIVGINGAGKSTLLRLLSGVYIPDGGSVSYDGVPPTDPKVRQDIFFLPDDPYYTSSSTPQSLFDLYHSFYPNADRDEFNRILSLYGINNKEKMRNFSKGMRRQTFIALALAIKPKYLLLDEAFDGLDPLARKVFKEHIGQMADQYGTSVVISSHSLRELEDFCDTFALIDKNTVRSHGDIASHVERLCKFELAFTSPVPKALFDSIPSCTASIRGKFVTVVMEGDPEQCQTVLLGLHPAVIEQMPLDFEEAFIHDVNKNRGDI